MTNADGSPADASDTADELAQLLGFFHVCPVGLVACASDGSVTMANPAAVNLLVPAVGAAALSNIGDALRPYWNELPELLADSGTGGVVRQRRRLEFSGDLGSAAETPSASSTWLAFALVHVEADYNMLVVADATTDVAAEADIRNREFRMRTLFDSIDEGYAVAEMVLDESGQPVDYRFVEANPQFEEMTGLTDPVGRTALELVPGLEQSWIDTYARVALQGETMRFEQESPVMGRWFDVFAMPVAPAGRFAIVFKDISERLRWERALEESAQFTRRVLDNLFSFVGVMEIDGTLIEANKAPLEAAGLEFSDVIGRKFWETYWWSHSPDEQDRMRDAARRAADGEIVRFDAEVRIAGDERMWIDFQLAPLRDDDGTITHLVPSGLDLTARKEAEHQRTLLLDAERRARRRTELLLRNATALAAAVTVDEFGDAVIESLSEGLGLEIVNIIVLDDGVQRVLPSSPVRAAAKVYGVSIESIMEQPKSVELPGAAAIRHDTTIVYNTAAEIRDRFPAAVAAFETHHIGSLYAAPLRGARGDCLGALVLAAPTEEWLDADTLALLHGFTGQSGLALERTLLYDRVVQAQRKEHDIAVSLQEALLPDRLVDVPSLEIATDYRAGSELLAVGGDWYETFEWPDGKVGVLVGDVAGHDLAATAAMGRLRAAVSVLAPLMTPTPTALLQAVEHCAAGPGGTDYMTVVCIVIDTTTGVVEYATAGHPPPLVVHPDGSPAWLDGANSVPIGVDTKHERPQGSLACEPGSLLVLYTDGLIEHPGEAITEGLARLADRAAELASTPATTVPGKLIGALVPNGPIDDVVVVAIRWQPQG